MISFNIADQKVIHFRETSTKTNISAKSKVFVCVCVGGVSIYRLSMYLNTCASMVQKRSIIESKVDLAHYFQYRKSDYLM